MRLFERKVRKSNELIRAEEQGEFRLVGNVLKPRLAVPARRILNSLISALNLTPENLEVQINLNDIEEITKNDNLKTKDYQLCALTVSSVAYTIKNPEIFKAVQLFEWVEYSCGSKNVRAKFSPSGAKFINEICPYTRYYLSDYLALSSTYSQSLFEFLKSWERQKEVTVNLTELQKILHFPNAYLKNMGELKRRVLEVARKEMKEKLKYIFSYKFNARRQPDRIVFTYNDDAKEQKELKPKQAAYLCALHLVNKNLLCDIYRNAQYKFQNYQEEQKCTQCRICTYMETLRRKRDKRRMARFIKEEETNPAPLFNE